MEELIVKNEAELLALAWSLGKPISSRINSSLIDNLVPLYSSDAHKHSLSATYGIDNFPFHTDGAYFPVPPRYMILRYTQGVEPATPTVFIDLNTIENDIKNKLKYSVWKVKSRKHVFLSSILSANGEVFRYDPCIMTPLNERNNNKVYFENILRSMPKIVVNWQVNKTIIVDNWKYIHSRPEVKNEEINFRTIQRILVV
jgi:alpha-ketoglutarate-dependent taurine dioxygenase